jgi:hypothetical protein
MFSLLSKSIVQFFDLEEDDWDGGTLSWYMLNIDLRKKKEEGRRSRRYTVELLSCKQCDETHRLLGLLIGGI